MERVRAKIARMSLTEKAVISMLMGMMAGLVDCTCATGSLADLSDDPDRPCGCRVGYLWATVVEPEEVLIWMHAHDRWPP